MKKRLLITKKIKEKPYKTLLNSIDSLLKRARSHVFRQINTFLVKTYWEIGEHIVTYEQKTNEKADYGSQLLDKISYDLRKNHGKGFSRSNVFNFRRFYLAYPKIQSMPGFLSWTHIVSLISVSDVLARSFYEKECIIQKWSTRELDRQINSMLFERLALSKDKKGVLKLAQKGQEIEKAEDIVKDPYVLEFLGLPQDYKFSEKELEEKIIDNMQNFLLELGQGFSFVARQFRISLANKHFYVDLVFYHRILKCFVLIDLKVGNVTHQDIGQMNLYLNYFNKEEMAKDDNEPIGIVLGAEKDHVLVEFALGGISNKLFASKYKLSLPNKQLLERAVKQMVSQEINISKKG